MHVGYRWFEKQNITPLFPFGYGLSYTTFAYSALKTVPTADDGLDVAFTVSNTGKVPSDEVPQVYLGAPNNPPRDTDFAVRALAGFDRIHLAAGESKAVTIHVKRRSLEYWFVPTQEWRLAIGPRDVLVGTSSRDIKLKDAVTITEREATH